MSKPQLSVHRWIVACGTAASFLIQRAGCVGPVPSQNVLLLASSATGVPGAIRYQTEGGLIDVSVDPPSLLTMVEATARNQRPISWRASTRCWRRAVKPTVVS